MIKLILRQFFFIITTFFGVTIITFSLLQLGTATIPENIGNLTNESIIQQYFHYLSAIFKGDLGISSVTRVAVTDEFLSHLPASIELVVLASAMALLIGLPLGVIAAINHRKIADTLINNISMISYSMPIFWWGILLIMFFSLSLGITPVSGRLSFLFDIEPVTGFILIDTLMSNEANHMDAFQDAILHLILPVIALATLPTAIITRMTRQAMLETLSNDYILTAQAKGLSRFKIYWVHGLRNALIPIIEMLGLQISTLMTGAMLTEYLFSWPGIGKWIIDALEKNDFESLQGGILITTTLVIFINAFIELFQIWLNPKLRKKVKIYNG
ncbi:MAG: ABC transporter permease subunit [Gammaproteobacteria bacterium]|nr:ABC transporter permease subunit [Gammaproteobacteria bacterium]